MTSVSLKDYLRELNQLLDQEAYEEVIGHGRHILQHFPKNVAVYEMLGKALFEKLRFDESEQVFLRLLTADPGSFVAHVNLSEIYKEHNDTVRAMWHLEVALEHSPNQAALLDELRGLYQQRHGHAPEKIQLTQAALAKQYINSGMYEQAISELYDVIQRQPERFDLRVMLMNAFWEADYVAEAGHVALDILKHLPDCLPANRLMTQLWILSRRPAEAQPFLQRVEALAPYQSMELLYKTLDPSSTVPDGTFSLPRLDWSAASSAFVETSTPDWFSDLGQAFEQEGEPPLATQPQGQQDVPDWIGGDEGAQQAQAADLPDWYTPATSEFGTGSLKQRGNTDKLNSPDDWFADMTSSVQPADTEEPGSAQQAAATTSVGDLGDDVDFEDWFGASEGLGEGRGGTDELPPLPQDDRPEDLDFLMDADDAVADDFFAFEDDEPDTPAGGRVSTGLTDMLSGEFDVDDTAAAADASDEYGTPDFDFFDTDEAEAVATDLTDVEMSDADLPDVDWLEGAGTTSASAATGFTGLLDDKFGVGADDSDDELTAFLDAEDAANEPQRQRTGVTDELLFGDDEDADDVGNDDVFGLPEFELESTDSDEMSWLLEDDEGGDADAPISTGITSELIGEVAAEEEPDFLDFDTDAADEDLDWLLSDSTPAATAPNEQRVRTGLTDELIGYDDDDKVLAEDDDDLTTLRDATRPPSPDEVAALLAAARGEEQDDDELPAQSELSDFEAMDFEEDADSTGMTDLNMLFDTEADDVESDETPEWLRSDEPMLISESESDFVAANDMDSLFGEEEGDSDALAGLFDDDDESFEGAESPSWMSETVPGESAANEMDDLFGGDDAAAELDMDSLFGEEEGDSDALAGLFDDDDESFEGAESPSWMSETVPGESAANEMDDLFGGDDVAELDMDSLFGEEEGDSDALAGLFDDDTIAAADDVEEDRVSTGMTGELLNRFEDIEADEDDGGRVSTGMTAMLISNFDDDEDDDTVDGEEGRVSTGLTGMLVSEFDDDDLSAILDTDDDEAFDGETINFLDEEIDREMLQHVANRQATEQESEVPDQQDVPDWLTQSTFDDETELSLEDDDEVEFDLNLDLSDWATEDQPATPATDAEDTPAWLSDMELGGDRPVAEDITTDELDFMAESASDEAEFDWMSAFSEEEEPQAQAATPINATDEELEQAAEAPELELDDILNLDLDEEDDISTTTPDESLAASQDLTDTKHSEAASSRRFDFRKPPRWMRRQSGGTNE